MHIYMGACLASPLCLQKQPDYRIQKMRQMEDRLATMQAHTKVRGM